MKNGVCVQYWFLSNHYRSIPDPVSGSSFPAIILMKVVLPVPFSPNMTRISESENCPASTSKLRGEK